MAIVTKTLDAIYLGEFGDMSLGFPTGNGFREDLAGSYSADGGTLTELRFRGDEDFQIVQTFLTTISTLIGIPSIKASPKVAARSSP
jgi:hypothetical protein